MPVAGAQVVGAVRAADGGEVAEELLDDEPFPARSDQELKIVRLPAREGAYLAL
jgi:hypothetical protein